MNERKLMRVKLADLVEVRKQLETKARINCERIGEIVNPLLNPFAEMKVTDAALLMDDLVMQQAEILNISSKINELEEALYG